MKKDAILVINNIPISYRNALFDEMHDMNDRVKVIFLSKSESVRNHTGKLEHLPAKAPFVILSAFLQYRRKTTTTSDLILSFVPLDEIRQAEIVLVFGYNYPGTLTAAIVAKILGKKTCLFCETTLVETSKVPWRRAMKKLIISRLFDLFVVPGAASQEFLESFGARPESIGVAVNACQLLSPGPNGGDERLRSFQSRFRIGLVGRLAPEKQFDWCIKTLSSDQTLEFHVAGDGPLWAKIASSAPSERVIMRGLLDRAQLATFYRSVDVVILPSEYEPWGFVINESLSAGTPVIVSDRVGCRHELVTELGTVFEFGDPRSLMKCVSRVRAQWPELSSIARNLALRYTMQRQATDLLRHISSDHAQ